MDSPFRNTPYSYYDNMRQYAYVRSKTPKAPATHISSHALDMVSKTELDSKNHKFPKVPVSSHRLTPEEISDIVNRGIEMELYDIINRASENSKKSMHATDAMNRSALQEFFVSLYRNADGLSIAMANGRRIHLPELTKIMMSPDNLTSEDIRIISNIKEYLRALNVVRGEET